MRQTSNDTRELMFYGQMGKGYPAGWADSLACFVTDLLQLPHGTLLAGLSYNAYTIYPCLLSISVAIVCDTWPQTAASFTHTLRPGVCSGWEGPEHLERSPQSLHNVLAR